MRKKIFLILMAGMFITVSSCRETEVNTDGNMEETETRSVEEET